MSEHPREGDELRDPDDDWTEDVEQTYRDGSLKNECWNDR